MKRLLIVLGLFISVSFAQDVRISVPYVRYVLSNGLNVILHEDHTIPSVAVNIWYNVGSAREKPGRTGFAHLFEHIMFMGSIHAPEGKFDQWLEAAGGDNNASTSEDATDYFENCPVNALALPLFLESDRMAYLLPAMTPAKVDAQRDVVKNERRQSYENRPYGMAEILISENLFPEGHPYHWPVIGSMADLSAASYDDVVDFFKKYYSTRNASLAVVGDIDTGKTRELIEYWFKDVPAGDPVPPPGSPAVYPTAEKRVIYEDRVQLPRVYMCWISPALYNPGDAEMDVLASILADGKNSRLYKRVVYDLQIAQDVSAYQASQALVSSFQVVATARSGHSLSEIERVIQEEINKIKIEPPTRRELQRVVNQYESSFLSRLENIGRVAYQLNGYYTKTGNPDYFNEDLTRYRALDPDDILSVAKTYLRDDGRMILSVVPQGKRELAATPSMEVK